MYILSGNDADFDDSVIKISIVDEFNIVHRKIRISSTSNTVAALIVAVSGLRKYAAVEDPELIPSPAGKKSVCLSLPYRKQPSLVLNLDTAT